MNDIEKLFTFFDDYATLLSEEDEFTYLEALAEVGEILYLQTIDARYDHKLREKLHSGLRKLNASSFKREDVHKAFHLAIIKGMKEAVQPNHQPTPDAVALFMSYFVEKLAGDKETVTLVDLALGSGNLAMTVLHRLRGKNVRMYGFEVDETLLKLAYVNANLLEQPIELFHDDSLRSNVVLKAHFVVVDLPVGFYPNGEVAEKFQLKETNGDSYIHHLMIEKALNVCMPGGFVLAVIPNDLFLGEQSERLNRYLKAEANVISLLQLPQSMFYANQLGKSIFVLQRKSEKTVQPRQALIAQLPSFTKTEQLADMMRKIDRWFAEFLHIK